MKVTLAHPYKTHRADDTIDVPDGEAMDLLAAGRARRYEEPAQDAPAEEPTPSTRTRTKKD